MARVLNEILAYSCMGSIRHGNCRARCRDLHQLSECKQHRRGASFHHAKSAAAMGHSRHFRHPGVSGSPQERTFGHCPRL